MNKMASKDLEEGIMDFIKSDQQKKKVTSEPIVPTKGKTIVDKNMSIKE